MGRTREWLRRYRVAALALVVSLALHAALLKGLPGRLDSLEPPADGIAYTATLDPAATAVEAPAPAPAPKPRPARHAAKPRLAPPPIVAPEPLDEVQGEVLAEAVAEAPKMIDPVLLPEPEPEPKPDVVAMAAPTAPPVEEPPQPFPTDALPESLSISYALTSAFADGRADYEWTRDGDSYRIHGEAQAEGFFTLFLEGRIIQESRGTVTPEGLRPERFVERRPGAEEEGLEFDWKQHQVTFERGDKKKTTEFKGNTVDWLSMIFQLAHVPPKPKGDSMELAVFTQRRFYSFKLKVLGVEEIDIPMGRVQALHLRHVDAENANEVVDVWLGVNQHYLPVKMRYPVARNRLVVEQSATRVSTR
ncbi:MAG TPA: DUF3108 domain-containing protein [Usitatibacter sp.]|nr:DUF3108 domain-containing protein [Usitatibacter sp.]